VALNDGTRSWTSSPTVGGDGLGDFALRGLPPGRYDATVSAPGFVSLSRQLEISEDTTQDFPLLPIPETKHFTFTGQISDTGGECSDGTRAAPCHINVLPIHNAGPIQATLSWSAPTGTVLTVTLFRTGDDSTPIARSVAVDTTTQELSADLPGLARYELRVLYFVSGAGTAAYQMPVTYQN
jgi:hypothetical protein